MRDITRRDFLNGVALTDCVGAHARRADRGAAHALSAGADRHARPARRFVRGRSRSARRKDVSVSTDCRSRSAMTWSWSAAASAGSRPHGSTGETQPRRAHPHSRQSRRFRRARQAQRIPPRWTSHHRLWRQRIAAIAAGALQPCRQGPAAGARRRRRALRHRVRAHALSLARTVARRVLSARGVRPGHARHRRPDRDGGRRSQPEAEQCQAAARVRRRVSGVGAEQGAARSRCSRAPPIRLPARPRRKRSRCSNARATATI